MAQERILISSDWGKVAAELVDNNATRSLVQMLPLTIEMRDHLRQEKTGNLPSPLPAVERQLDFSTGTLGLWSSNHFVIYYRDGRVPQPGIVLLGRVTGDVSISIGPVRSPSELSALDETGNAATPLVLRREAPVGRAAPCCGTQKISTISIVRLWRPWPTKMGRLDSGKSKNPHGMGRRGF